VPPIVTLAFSASISIGTSTSATLSCTPPSKSAMSLKQCRVPSALIRGAAATSSRTCSTVVGRSTSCAAYS
jgi:hypothetical protein